MLQLQPQNDNATALTLRRGATVYQLTTVSIEPPVLRARLQGGDMLEFYFDWRGTWFTPRDPATGRAPRGWEFARFRFDGRQLREV